MRDTHMTRHYRMLRELNDGPGPLLARPISAILREYERRTLDAEDAAERVEAVLSRPLTLTLDPEETRRRLADPEVRQYLAWQAAQPAHCRKQTARNIVGSEHV